MEKTSCAIFKSIGFIQLFFFKQIAVVAESQVPGGGNKENGEVASCTNRRHEQLKSKQRNASKGKMEANDLFKAELVFISDSDEDKNTAAGNGYGHARALILDTSPLSTNGVKLRSTSPLSHADHPHHSASQQKTTQVQHSSRCIDR